MTSSSSWYYSDEESYTISSERPLHLLNPNQFYKICPPGAIEYFANTNGDNNDDFNAAYEPDENGPICGDGSPFCFYFAKPAQKAANRDRLLIEIMGGGACWDAETCEKQEQMLYVQDEMDDALGRSCQEIQYGMQREGKATTMLCSVQLDESSIDFNHYNSIIIPYCTQDVHLGSNMIVYSENDDDNDEDVRTVYHMGAKNLRFVLDWVYSNFPGLRHAAITGCSAGGTAVPVVQSLIHRHYNHFGNRATQVASVADSPVYLTPAYFLENALGNWNPQPILSSIGVPYEKYRSSGDYPTMMWDYILRKGSNKNRWGFVSHTDDPVSLMYYQYMSGNDDDDDDDYYGNDNYNNREKQRLLEDVEQQWYSELTKSMKYIEKRHRNVKSYWMDSEGHCSFGLHYALQEENFPEFATSVFKEDALFLSAQPAVRSFCLSAMFGSFLVTYLVFQRIRRQSSLQICDSSDEIDTFSAKDGLWNIDDNDTATTSKKSKRSVPKRLKSLLVSMEEYPVTSGYTVCITVYLLAMIIAEGFAHPVNNPSLGPSAIGLSIFGINNPSLIVYEHQWIRFFTSNFLVSGLLTYGLALFYLWFRIRKLEQRLTHDCKSPWLFVTVSIILATTINAVYCLIPSRRGASTAGIPLLIGLQTFHLTFYWNSFVRPYLSIGAIIFDFFLVVTIFTFNSWVMIFTACVTGWILAKMARTFDVWLPGPAMNILKQSGITMELGSTASVGEHSNNVVTGIGPTAFGTALNFPSAAASESEYNNFDGNLSNSYETMDDQRSTCPDRTKTRRWKFLRRVVTCCILALGVLIVVPSFVSGVAKPNQLYVEPFYTGCKSFYTIDIDDLADSWNSDDEVHDGANDRARRSLAGEATENFVRWLGGDENRNGDYECAEFCIPHLMAPVFSAVLKKQKIPIVKGRCVDNGYSIHTLDKTFSAWTYSLDVELYAEDDEEERN